MIAQRYVLGYAFTWDDLITVARERARSCGRRQKVTRDEDTWLVVTTPEPLTRPTDGPEWTDEEQAAYARASMGEPLSRPGGSGE